MDADAERIELLLGAGGQVTVFISFIAAKIAPVQRVSIAVIQEQQCPVILADQMRGRSFLVVICQCNMAPVLFTHQELSGTVGQVAGLGELAVLRPAGNAAQQRAIRLRSVGVVGRICLFSIAPCCLGKPASCFVICDLGFRKRLPIPIADNTDKVALPVKIIHSGERFVCFILRREVFTAQVACRVICPHVERLRPLFRRLKFHRIVQAFGEKHVVRPDRNILPLHRIRHHFDKRRQSGHIRRVDAGQLV